MELYSKYSKIKRFIILFGIIGVLIYVYAFYAEYSCIREVFLNRIDESTKFGGDSTLLFLSQNKVLSPFAWFSDDADGQFLASTQRQYKNSKLIIKKASDAFYFRDTSKILSAWNSGFRDKLTNKFGEMLIVGPIIWQSPISILVPLGVSGGPSYYSAFYILTFNGFVWKITGWEVRAISNNLCQLTRRSS